MPADFPELQRGDVIEEIDQQPVTSVNEIQQSRGRARPRQHPRVFHVPPSRSLIHCGATALGESGARTGAGASESHCE